MGSSCCVLPPSTRAHSLLHTASAVADASSFHAPCSCCRATAGCFPGAASQVHVLLPSISSSNHRDQQKPCSRTELYTASWTASHLCCRCSGHRVHHSPCPNGPNVRALASTGCTLRSHVKFPSISYEESLPCLDHDVMLPPSCCQCCGIGAAGLLLRHR